MPFTSQNPTRMPDYSIENCKVEDFGMVEFKSTQRGPKPTAEGRFTFISYVFGGPRTNEPSGLAVIRNYENAITKVGVASSKATRSAG